MGCQSAKQQTIGNKAKVDGEEPKITQPTEEEPQPQDSRPPRLPLARMYSKTSDDREVMNEDVPSLRYLETPQAHNLRRNIPIRVPAAQS